VGGCRHRASSYTESQIVLIVSQALILHPAKNDGKKDKSNPKPFIEFPTHSLGALLGPATAFVYDGNFLTDHNISFDCLMLSIFFLNATAAGSVDEVLYAFDASSASTIESYMSKSVFLFP